MKTKVAQYGEVRLRPSTSIERNYREYPQERIHFEEAVVEKFLRKLSGQQVYVTEFTVSNMKLANKAHRVVRNFDLRVVQRRYVRGTLVCWLEPR